MKKPVLLLLVALVSGCKKDDPIDYEFEVQTQGRNRDCGMPQVVVADPAGVKQVVGSSIGNATYLALKLDTALWLRKNQTLLLRIRRPTSEELSFVCTAMGPTFPALTVVSARVK